MRPEPPLPVPSLDVLGLGCVAVDDLLYVREYPPADAKTPVERRERQCGGLVATALVAAARLGARSAYAGVLGDDELSSFAAAELEKEGVDTSHLLRRPGARPIHSVVIVAEEGRTRNVFFDTSGFPPAPAAAAGEALVRSARVLLVDHHGTEVALRAARTARARGIPVVADFESSRGPCFEELLGVTGHLVLGADFARGLTGEPALEAAARRLWSEERQAVVLTDGARGATVLLAGERAPRHQPAFAVDVVDTTGCGDVFHGAYAAGLAWGLAVPECVRLAAAAAALKATRRGGQRGIPHREEVERFLDERGAGGEILRSAALRGGGKE